MTSVDAVKQAVLNQVTVTAEAPVITQEALIRLKNDVRIKDVPVTTLEDVRAALMTDQNLPPGHRDAAVKAVEQLISRRHWDVVENVYIGAAIAVLSAAFTFMWRTMPGASLVPLAPGEVPPA